MYWRRPQLRGSHRDALPIRKSSAILHTKGYEENLKLIVNNAVFQEDHDKMGALPFLPYPPPN